MKAEKISTGLTCICLDIYWSCLGADKPKIGRWHQPEDQITAGMTGVRLNTPVIVAPLHALSILWLERLTTSYYIDIN